MDELLITLFAQRLSRARRCGNCLCFEPWLDGDRDDAAGWGECEMQPATYVHEGDRCTAWTPVASTGLDPLGIPLTSPASPCFEGGPE